MLGGADNPNGELLSYIIGADIHGYLSGFIGFCPRTGLSVPVSDLRL